MLIAQCLHNAMNVFQNDHPFVTVYLKKLKYFSSLVGDALNNSDTDQAWSSATECTGSKWANSMDKNVPMCSANQEEKVSGPPVNKTSHACRVSSLLWQFATLIGIGLEPSKVELEGEVRRCTCLLSIMLSMFVTVCFIVNRIEGVKLLKSQRQVQKCASFFFSCDIIDRHC